MLSRFSNILNTFIITHVTIFSIYQQHMKLFQEKCNCCLFTSDTVVMYLCITVRSPVKVFFILWNIDISKRLFFYPTIPGTSSTIGQWHLQL